MKTVGKLFAYTLGLIAFVLFLVGLTTDSIPTLSISTFCAWAMAIIMALCAKKRNAIYIFFLTTFFIFLLSRIMVRWLRTGEIYIPYSTEAMRMTYCCIIISLFGLVVGNNTANIRFHLSRNKNELINSGSFARNEKRNSKLNLPCLRLLSAMFSIVCGLATLLVVIERIAFWRVIGIGGELRTSFVSALPEIVLRLSYIYVLMFCIYLATLPEKRRCIPIILQYLIVSAMKMFYGSRVDFVVGLMFILIYFTIRDRMNNEDKDKPYKWIGRPEKLFTFISIPVLIILMVFVENFRTHSTFEFSGFLKTLGDFFEAQGTSVNVIGYTEIYADKFMQPKYLYLFDNTYEFITANPLSKILTGRTAYLSNTVDRALYGTSLEMTLYYNMNQVSYLAGNGCGSSYIAEAWLGYGYVGLFILNLMLSRVMEKINEYRFDRLIPSVVTLVFLQSLFFTPRAGFDEFVGDLTSVTHIIAIIILWILYKLLDKRVFSY